MSNKHHPHGEPVRWPTPNRRALATRRRELEDALLAEERRYADAHIKAVGNPVIIKPDDPENDARFWRQFADHWRAQVVVNDERPATSRWAVTGVTDSEAFTAAVKRAIESARKDS